MIFQTKMLDLHGQGCQISLNKNTSSLLKLKKEFINSRFKDHDDPDEWITVLEEIQTKFYDRDPAKTAHQISGDSLMNPNPNPSQGQA